MRRSLGRLNEALALIFVVATLTTMLSATIGVTSLRLGGVVAAAAVPETWRAWWIGDALGDLIVGALILVWSEPVRERGRGGRLERMGLAILTVALAVTLFFERRPASTGSAFLEGYALFPVLVWAAVRFGLRGASLATFAVAAVAVAGTALGGGPFVRETLAHSLLLLQIFMAVVAATGLVLGAAITERANAVRSRDEILAIVSHDLRNPLSATKIGVGTAKRALQANDSERLARDLGVVERSTARMETLIQDLVDLASLDAGRLAAPPGTSDVGLLLREAIEMLRPLAERAGVALELDKPEGVPPVRCTSHRVHRVLSNLVGNAIEHTPKGGKVVVSARSAGDWARFEVSDTGSGIEPEDVPHVFDRFRRGVNAGGEGLGLGLYISKGIVEAYGGSIGLQSQRGKGSTFSFTLPLIPASERPARAPAPEHAPHRA
jgi:signal transduction histidine kinase